MCVMCRTTPCKTGCPNESKPTPVIDCTECGIPLYVGDKAYFINTPMNGIYILCEECIRKAKKEITREICFG